MMPDVVAYRGGRIYAVGLGSGPGGFHLGMEL